MGRVISYPEKTGVEEGDFILMDSGTAGTKKIKPSNLIRIQSVTISGTTPTITAQDGIRYICGEVTSLDFTPSATGICDVVFTSGSTPTVLTLPNTVRIPSWFVVEANTTYEINIADGVYGSVMSWT